MQAWHVHASGLCPAVDAFGKSRTDVERKCEFILEICGPVSQIATSGPDSGQTRACGLGLEEGRVRFALERRHFG